ncbi:MAG: hypothetical protein K0R67_2726 [Paenibacillus sp.]|nr:hypothetical protein [Paenibacillus sp.]
MLLLLAACGGEKTSGSSPAAVPSSSPTPKAASPTPDNSQPRVIKHKYGETKVPASPKRIVSFNLEDMLLSLKLPLVMASPHGENYYLEDRLKEAKIPMTLWASDNINFEAILSANPDLILATEAITQAAYDQMSKIAPTVVFNRDAWRTSIVEIGKTVGLETEAVKVVKDYDEKVKQAKATITKAVGENKTVAFLRTQVKSLQLYFPTYLAEKTAFPTYVGLIYTDLGLTPIAKVTELAKATPDRQNALISQEVLPELNADYLFVTTGGSTGNAETIKKNQDDFSEVEKSAVWKSIPAVAQNRVYYVSPKHWISFGPIADEMKVNDVVNALTRK